MKLWFFDTDKTSVPMTYDHRNTGTREDPLRARSEGRSLMARRRVTIVVYRFSPREDLYARTQRHTCRHEIFLQGKVLWCDTRIPPTLALILRTRCQRNTRGRKNPRSQAFGKYGVGTTPKTVKSCVFFLERLAHFCDFFYLHMLFSHERARAANGDIQTHPHLPHSTPFQPQSPLLYNRVYTLK